jgi:hypothetical protein
MSKCKLAKLDVFMSLLYRKLRAVMKPLSYVGGNSKCVLTTTEANTQVKGKAIPVTGHEGPEACEMSRLPHFLDNQLTDGGKVVSLTR